MAPCDLNMGLILGTSAGRGFTLWSNSHSIDCSVLHQHDADKCRHLTPAPRCT